VQAKAGGSAIAIVTGADSGPPDPNSRDILQYNDGFKQLSDAGVGLAGYVSTKYGARALSDVVADVSAWYDQHGGQMAGIFLDEYPAKVALRDDRSVCSEGCRDVVDTTCEVGRRHMNRSSLPAAWQVAPGGAAVVH
jgi:Spherulation-specific family 4